MPNVKTRFTRFDLNSKLNLEFSLPFKHTCLFLLPAIVSAGLTGCGYQDTDGDSSLKAESQDFTAWCADWEIDCSPKPKAVETKTAFNSENWEALTAVGSELLKGSVRFRVTRTDITSPQLAAGLEKLGMGTEFNDFKTKLDHSQWQSFGIEAGRLVSHSLVEGTLTAANGLVSKSGTSLSLSAVPGGVVQIEGLSLASKSGDHTSKLTLLTLGEKDTLNLTFNDQIVKNVPFSYLEDGFGSTFGLEAVPSQPKDFSRQQVVEAMYPLLSWVNKPERTATLTRKFFALAESQFRPVLSSETSGPALLTLLSALDGFDFSATPGQNVVQFVQVLGARLKCKMNDGESTLMFDKEFGLKRYYPVDGGIGLELYGVKATARLALGIPLTLKRIEIKNNKIVILDIPIISKIEFDLDKFAAENEDGDKDKSSTMACSK